MINTHSRMHCLGMTLVHRYRRGMQRQGVCEQLTTPAAQWRYILPRYCQDLHARTQLSIINSI